MSQLIKLSVLIRFASVQLDSRMNQVCVCVGGGGGGGAVIE